MLQSKNKNQMEIWESALLPLCAAVTRVWSCFSIVLLPTGSSPFHHLIFLVTDIVFAKRKKKNKQHCSERTRLVTVFSSAVFSGPEISWIQGPRAVTRGQDRFSQSDGKPTVRLADL